MTAVEIRVIGAAGGGGSGHSSSGGSVTTGASAGGGVGGSTFQLLQPGDTVSMGPEGSSFHGAVSELMAGWQGVSTVVTGGAHTPQAEAVAPEPHPMCQCETCLGTQL